MIKPNDKQDKQKKPTQNLHQNYRTPKPDRMLQNGPDYLQRKAIKQKAVLSTKTIENQDKVLQNAKGK